MTGRAHWEKIWRGQARWELLLAPVRRVLMSRPFAAALPAAALAGAVLEAGAGTAAGSIEAGRRAGARVVALDIAEPPLRRALAGAGGVRISAVVGSLDALPFRAGAFSLVWNVSTLEHFRDPIPVLREMARCGRWTAAAVPGESRLWRVVLGAMESIGYEGTGDYYRLFRREEIIRVFHAARIEGVEVRTFRLLGLFPFHLAWGRAS